MPSANLQLSANDQQVLESIFNPLELSSSISSQVHPESELTDIDTDLEPELASSVRKLELQAVRLTEEGDIDKALAIFDEALKLTEKASLLNNRAQALLLARRDEDALEDLNRALIVATDQQIRTKCHAHCQRGVLHRKLDNLDKARDDFESAAKLGSKFAREQLVEINPFAALCNQMLRQAFDQLK
ncbi:tetratricopeptide repeat protein 36 homolog [Drosophila tropicalis]|uniref:tetratricopeptide repeat protein 36 homolog n=1 Tax=Drosophila tropicalis TaxID=46794 RepID=UPI0035AB7FFD